MNKITYSLSGGVLPSHIKDVKAQLLKFGILSVEFEQKSVIDYNIVMTFNDKQFNDKEFLMSVGGYIGGAVMLAFAK